MSTKLFLTLCCLLETSCSTKQRWFPLQEINQMKKEGYTGLDCFINHTDWKTVLFTHDYDYVLGFFKVNFGKRNYYLLQTVAMKEKILKTSYCIFIPCRKHLVHLPLIHQTT